MMSIKKILGVLVVMGFTLLVPNNVNAITVTSEESLKTTFNGYNVTLNGATVTLNENIDFSETEEIFELAGNYIFNLNGYTLKMTELSLNSGTLTINDLTGNGKIDTVADFIKIADGATFVLNNGKIDYLANEGTATINNGEIDAITNYGTIIIENGNFGPIWQRGNATINGGTFISNSDMMSLIDLDGGTTVISGEVVFKKTDGTNSALIVNSGDPIEPKIFNQLLKGEYVALYTGYGSNSETWYDEEIGEIVYRYEVNYEPIKVIIDESDSIFEKVAPNSIWKINASKPKDMEESEFLLTSVAGDYTLPEGYELWAYCEPDDEFNPENVTLILSYEVERGIFAEVKYKNVKAIYNEPSDEMVSKANSIIEKIEKFNGGKHSVETGFRLDDLYLINYLNANSKGLKPALEINFAKDLIEMTNGSNITYKIDSRLGEPGILWSYGGGEVIVYYDEYAVGTAVIGVTRSHVLYVPSDTLDTDEARIAAALKRIGDYLGTTDGISIEVGGTLDSLNKEGLTWKDKGFIDEKTSGSNYYNITINGKIYEFVICKKDASQLETPEFLASDIISNIIIKSNSTELPLDTAITVKSVSSDNIAKALGTDVYAAYDISLYSSTKEVDITKINNGKFVVSIPVPEKLKDKDVTVYYVNINGEKEEHNATVKDGIASFETDHFSTYAIVEKMNIENPKTFDDIGQSILVGIISLIGLVGATIYIKKRVN